MSALNPIREWIRPVGQHEVALVEPTGDKYNPEGPPAWMSNNGFDFLRRHARAEITLVYGNQRTGSDLGGPGEFERLAEEGIVGNEYVDGEIYGGEGYVSRIKVATRGENRTFDISTSRVWQDNQTVRGVRKSLYANGCTLANPFLDRFSNDSPNFADSVYAAQAAGYALYSNTLDWMVLNRAGQELKRQEELRGEVPKVVLALSPDRLGIVRRAAFLGLKGLAVRRIDEQQWPREALEESSALEKILATGRYNLKELVQISRGEQAA